MPRSSSAQQPDADGLSNAELATTFRDIADMLDVLVEEDVWVATENGRKPRSRAELAKLIDDSVWKEANA